MTPPADLLTAALAAAIEDGWRTVGGHFPLSHELRCTCTMPTYSSPGLCQHVAAAWVADPAVVAALAAVRAQAAADAWDEGWNSACRTCELMARTYGHLDNWPETDPLEPNPYRPAVPETEGDPR